MEAVRQSWTDDRLDEFGRRMDERVDRHIGELRQDNRLIEAELGSVQRAIIQVGGGLLAANVGLMAAVIGLMITQL